MHAHLGVAADLVAALMAGFVLAADTVEAVPAMMRYWAADE
jgi:hypothetical protein